jgi:tRNA G37 N-methylase Trm5
MNPFENIKLKVNPDLHNILPKKWKKIGDIIIIDFKSIDKDKKKKIAKIYAEELRVKTAIQKSSVNGELRKPKDIELLYGKETITEISEYGIKYKLDIAEIMWSPGNTGWRSALAGPEKVRDFYSFNEPKVIIDYFAGIGYFAIQMAKGYPKSKIIAIDKNPKSIEYLTMNCKKNGIENIEIINDDCRNINSKADVIHLGYIGNTKDFLDHTYNCLKENGITIFHEAYRNNWLGFKSRSDWIGIPDNFSKLMKTKGFTVEKIERVKFYGPSTSHIIAILRKN